MIFQKTKTLYLDHAATTPLKGEVFEAMKPWMTEHFANPSSLYKIGVHARNAAEQAREMVAKELFTQPDTVIFTSGGTESCNLAIMGLAKHFPKGHIITTRVEHHSVLYPVQELEKNGYEVTYLELDNKGNIDLQQFKKALRPDTFLISIMYVNNEIGTVSPIAEIGKEILKFRKENVSAIPYFFTDACQASLLDLQVQRLHVDMMAINGSKIYGPKGSAILYKRRGVPLHNIIYGGGQEYGLRPGTEDMASIVGFAKAFELHREKREEKLKKLFDIQQYFYNQLRKYFPNIILNGNTLSNEYLDNPKRVYNNLSITFPGIEAEKLMLYLSEKNIFVGLGSACSTNSDDISHVLHSIGMSEQAAKSTIRLSYSSELMKKDIDYFIDVLKKILPLIHEKSV